MSFLTGECRHTGFRKCRRADNLWTWTSRIVKSINPRIDIQCEILTHIVYTPETLGVVDCHPLAGRRLPESERIVACPFLSLHSHRGIKSALPCQLEKGFLISDMIVAEHHVVCLSCGKKLLRLLSCGPRWTFLDVHP